MPRRESIVSPELAVNARYLVSFIDGSTIFIHRDIYGYHCKGRPVFTRTTKTALDETLSIIAEDRGGLNRFIILEGY